MVAGSDKLLGDVTMQRYLPSGFGYKYISSPFQAATVNELSLKLNLAASFPPSTIRRKPYLLRMGQLC